MSEYADPRARIEGREVIVLDGAIGTRLQRMEMPLSHDAWAAIALETHPFAVRRLHARTVARTGERQDAMEIPGRDCRTDDSRAPASTAEAALIAPGAG